jgi:hypothetical protein
MSLSPIRRKIVIGIGIYLCLLILLAAFYSDGGASARNGGGGGDGFLAMLSVMGIYGVGYPVVFGGGFLAALYLVVRTVKLAWR